MELIAFGEPVDWDGVTKGTSYGEIGLTTLEVLIKREHLDPDGGLEQDPSHQELLHFARELVDEFPVDVRVGIYMIDPRWHEEILSITGFFVDAVNDEIPIDVIVDCIEWNEYEEIHADVDEIGFRFH